MKLLHTADLHIGKRVNEFSMLDDQEYILLDILRIIDETKPEGILLAGDIYDKSVPPGEAVDVLDEFLTGLVERRLQVFVVSGNHDSPERLNFGSRILQKAGLHIAGTFDGKLKKITLNDAYGPVHIYLLPFIKPAQVQAYYPEESIASYTKAVQTVLDQAQIDTQERNVLVCHQFITSGTEQPERSESETVALGGLDNVDAAVFTAFDYVALGHLHGPQRIGAETIRYSGSPLKYSFSEARQHKSLTLLELHEKGTVSIEKIPLQARRDLREIKGPLAELLSIGDTESNSSEDYIRAILTDDNEIYDAIGQLRQVYPNVMRLDFENSRNRQTADSRTAASGDITRVMPLELFKEFYAKQNNSEMTEEQQAIMNRIIEQAGGARQ
ncbi:exonuclease SbcCD subunit D [Dehalobacter sp. DCM]|uniref:exonuclease SbcCD subunit D n=1 Tax=Dehalobacter sp. DCM TaxID=2907827 RepID=UPI00308209DA|nr:exonuclease SbcCD subunit D [Dehalobacter sp. DCM]